MPRIDTGYPSPRGTVQRELLIWATERPSIGRQHGLSLVLTTTLRSTFRTSRSAALFGLYLLLSLAAVHSAAFVGRVDVCAWIYAGLGPAERKLSRGRLGVHMDVCFT